MIDTTPDILPSIAAWWTNRDPDISSAERGARLDLKYHQKRLLEWRQDRDLWPDWWWEQERLRFLFICQWQHELIEVIRKLEGK